MSFRLDRLPAPVDLGEYQRVAAEVESQLASLPGLVAIYGLGGLSAPGISDLDRIAVVQAGGGRIPPIWPSLSDRERYVTLHTPFLVDVDTFRAHRWLAHLEPLELLAGGTVHVEEPPERLMLDRLVGLEGLVLARLRLEKLRVVRRIKVRPFLCELHNLRHNLRLLEVSADAAPGAWRLVRAVEKLRSEWWEMGPADRAERVVNLAVTGTEAVDEALARCDDAAEGAEMAFQLHGSWANVRLVTTATKSTGVGRWVPATTARYSQRVSELRWRAAVHDVCVPPGVIASLTRAAEPSGVLSERRTLVRRYQAFMLSQPGWSSIGFAGAYSSQ